MKIVQCYSLTGAHVVKFVSHGVKHFQTRGIVASIDRESGALLLERTGTCQCCECGGGKPGTQQLERVGGVLAVVFALGP